MCVTGLIFGVSVTVRIVFTSSDHSLSLSIALNTTVCSPIGISEFVKVSFVLTVFPSTVHRYAAIVPSWSVAFPVNVTSVPSVAGLGLIDTMFVTGAIF